MNGGQVAGAIKSSVQSNGDAADGTLRGAMNVSFHQHAGLLRPSGEFQLPP